MIRSYFDIAFDYLMVEEGGKHYTNRPHDAGGPTKFGITKKTFSEFFNRDDVLDSEIENMSEDVAKQIYWALYWLRLSCDKINNLGIAICIFSSGALYGVGTVALLTQHTLSLCGATLKFDGILGDKSVKFLNIVTGGSFIQAFHGLVLDRIDTVILNHPEDEEDRNGWTARANRMLRLSDEKYLKSLQGVV